MNDVSKTFIKRLSEEQFKNLIYYCLIENYKRCGLLYLDENEEKTFKYETAESENSYIIVNCEYFVLNDVNSKMKFYTNFMLDDYSMYIYDKNSKEDISNILRVYLTNIFHEEYVNALFVKEVNDARVQRDYLLKNSSVIDDIFVINEHELTRKK
ncbi:MAG: hypothetical protein IJ572_05925 [Bacilli bacterium]|nr:hypothetical protein [Bacilli bacterium]